MFLEIATLTVLVKKIVHFDQQDTGKKLMLIKDC